jgi:hypothetical protein
MDDQRLDRIENKLDSVNSHISSIDMTLAGQAVDLKEHVRRTNLLEEKVIHIDAERSEFKGAIKFLKIVGVLVAVAEGIRHLMR